MKLHSLAAWKKAARSWLEDDRDAAAGPRRAGGGRPGGDAVGDVTKLSPRERRKAAHAIAAGVEFLLPTRPVDEILPGADRAEVVMLPRLIRHHLWSMPEHELLVLGAIATMINPTLVVEFGTFQGGSTLALAANMPDGGRVVTVDLDPAERRTHEHGLGTGLMDFDLGCLFRGTRYESMIEQRYSNTLAFDADDLLGRADLVFVDADHTYEFTKRDTAKAESLVRPGGWILWHDYTWAPENSECAGVTKAVNEFFQHHGACFQIAKTRFAIHRVPGAAMRKSA
jgi:predicted O-methyltransferase YrrM